MYAYRRPDIESADFRDAAGEVIDYGNRWNGSPPDGAYSVITHPERFAPLHVVADALIAHLEATYYVDVIDGAGTADVLTVVPPDIVRAVCIKPHDPASAVLTFVYTSFPGIFLHAGALHTFPFPVCGCDACDSTWEREVEELEDHVTAVVSGGLRESIGPGPRPWVASALTFPQGSKSGTDHASDLTAERIEKARRILRDIPEGWSAWSTRQGSAR